MGWLISKVPLIVTGAS